MGLLEDFFGVVDRAKRDPYGSLVDYGRGAARGTLQGAADLGDIATKGFMPYSNPQYGEWMKGKIAESPLASTGTNTDEAGALIGVPQNLGMKGVGLLGTFAGMGAKGADLGALRKALEMSGKGETRKEIWDVTGWFKGKDGKWRWEIPDNASTFDAKTELAAQRASHNTYQNDLFEQMWIGNHKAQGGTVQDAMNKWAENFGRPMKPENIEIGSKVSMDTLKSLDKASVQATPKAGNLLSRVSDVYQNDKVMDAYPGLADLNMRIKSPDLLGLGTRGEHSASGISLLDEIAYKNPAEARSVMGHEGQHYIQRKEGFAYGGDPDEFRAGNAFSNERVIKAAQEIRGQLVSEHKRLMAEAAATKNVAEKKRLLQEAETAAQRLSDFTPGGIYKRLLGEAEARLVQKRMDYSPQMRKAIPPFADYDIPESKLLVKHE